ncbi:MAG: putative porin [Alistipes sp.]|nr:putative porin [Candidatus Alistipes equi]
MRKNFVRVFHFFLLMLFLLASWMPAHAQLDASALMRAQRNATNDLNNTGQNPMGYGQNPYNNTEEQQDNQQQDTTKKERIRRPLESYYFNDSIRALRNFTWNIKKDYNKIELHSLDTMLTEWRIDYVHYRKRLGDNSVGGLGQASQPVNYFERSSSKEFTFSQPYNTYNFNAENVNFFNMKHPFIWLTYLESGQIKYREEHFEAMVSQNISPSTSVGVQYFARGAKGKYDRSRVKNHNLAVTFAHTGKRYSVHAAYINNHIEQMENGGVVGEWAIRDTVFEMPNGVPMKLATAEAENIYRNNAFFIRQALGIPLMRMTEHDFSMAELSAVYIGHTFEYNAWSKTYNDKYATYTNERAIRNLDGTFSPITDVYYKDWFNHPLLTRDSIYERVITNRFFVEAQPWDRNGVVGTIDGGVGIDNHTYSQSSLTDYLSGKTHQVKKTSWFAYGEASGKIKRYVAWDANIKFYPSGYRGGDLSIGAHASFTAYIRKRPFILEGWFTQSRTTPGYWQNSWFSNHYIWANDFSKENETRFEVSFRVPDNGIELGFWQSILGNKIYYGPDSRPYQSSSSVSVTSVYAQKNFTIKGLHLDHRFLVQLTSDERVVPLPLFSAFLSYYYEFWIKRDVLRLQIGADGRFNTAYKAPGYNPALSVFYNQDEVSIGKYPYIDLFLSAKWKRMRILIKYQHLNCGLFGNGDYFAVAKYPLNPGMFKIGLSWAFYD